MAGWTKIASVDSLPEGRGVRVEAGSHRIALFRVGEDVLAVGDRCSHAEASLAEGDLFDEEIECPRHGATFDLRTGRAVSLPATKPVTTYETRTDDGEVYVRLDDRETS